jgi:hypothetical protein
MLPIAFAANIYAQTTFKGTVYDSLRVPIAFANVSVRSQINNSVIAGTIANAQGQYSITLKTQGNFNLFFSALSYKPQVFKITVKEEKTEIVRDIFLQSAPITLKTVTITPPKPIEIRGDTIIYNALDFATGREVVIEDLLKQLPGFQVLESGRIRVGNSEITKVLIEGDDFLGSSYSIMTQGVQSDVVDKVEVIHNYTENRLLKKIKKRGETVINIKLKDQFFQQVFGNIDAVGDVANFKHYRLKGNLMLINKKIKIASFANMNNIGDRAIRDAEGVMRDNNYEVTKMSGSHALGMLYFEGERPDLNDRRTHLNNEKMATVSAIYHPFKNVKVQNLGIVDGDILDFHNLYIQNYVFGNENFTNTTQTTRRLKSLLGSGKMGINWDISKNFIFDYSLRYSYQKQNGKSDLFFNGDTSLLDFLSEQMRWEQKFCLTSNINETDILLFKGAWNTERYPQRSTTDTFLYGDYFPLFFGGNRAQQNVQTQSDFGGLELHYLRNFSNGATGEIEAIYQFQKDIFNSNYNVYKNDTLSGTPDSLSNKLNYLTHTGTLGLKYHQNFNDYFGINGSLRFSVINSGATTLTNKFKTFFCATPTFSLDLYPTGNRTHYLSGIFSYTMHPPEIADVFEGYIEQMSHSFYRGGANILETLKSTSLMGLYNYISNKRTSWGASVSYIIYHDFYGVDAIVKQNYTFSEKVLMHNNQTVFCRLYGDIFLDFMKSNLNLELDYTYSYSENIVNENKRNIKSNGFFYKAEIRSAFTIFFNFHIGTHWNTYQIKSDGTFFNYKNFSFLDLHFLYKDFSASIKTERYGASGEGYPEKGVYFMDITSKYKLPKYGLTISLSALNIFNNKLFVTTNVNDLFFAQASYRINPLMVLIGVEFKPKPKMNKKSSNE